VDIERFASDGKTDYFGNLTQTMWKARKGELWLTAPVRMRITSYEEMPMSLAGNSTTFDGEGEIVDVGEGLADRDYPADVKGKILLASGVTAAVVAKAVDQKGALGVISWWSVPPFDLQNRLPGDFPQQVGWSSIAPARPGQPARFAFLVSERQAQQIKGMLKQGAVRARAIVDAESSAGALEVVTGVIPGVKYPGEEIVISAHLDHYKPGANDNASGSGAILEMARALNQMIAARQLPPPLRTIRFMWVPEYSGTRAWFSKHLGDTTTRVAELNFDMVGENVKSTNAVTTVSYLPDANASFLNAVTESTVDFLMRYNDDRYARRPELQVMSLTGSRDRPVLRMMPYMTGTDHELFNMAGIPGTTLGTFPDDYYHSSGDSIEQVDATQLHRAVVFGLVGMTTIAYADDAQAPDLAWLAVLYGRKRATSAEFGAVRGLLASTKDQLNPAIRYASTLMTHVHRRERAAVASAAVFAKAAETKRRIDRLAVLFDQDLLAAQKRVEDVAATRTQELGAPRATTALSEAEKRAAHVFPEWVPGKRLTDINGALSKVMATGDPAVQLQKIQGALGAAMSTMRGRGESELRIMGLPNAPATWVDGKRSLLEIRDALGVEYAPMPVDGLEAYFRAFEKAGAMKIREEVVSSAPAARK
ncbi:MAG: M28 family peptidase, partial [Bacteroidales bacterium]